MKAKILNRAALAFWLIYLPISELGAAASYLRMVETFLALAVMAWLGWMERDHTKISTVQSARGPAGPQNEG